ncbi:MAG: hypothetical protein LBQ88_03875 [Treponema sp.]|jgi:hypothetical protein|nr:hypothetical protein [Treponema sp.]
MELSEEAVRRMKEEQGGKSEAGGRQVAIDALPRIVFWQEGKPVGTV